MSSIIFFNENKATSCPRTFDWTHRVANTFAHTLRACALLLDFEKFTRAYLFQIALEIIWLSVQSVM